MTTTPLDDDDRAIYEWQMSVPGVGEEGQRRLKGASVLVTRVGGLGGVAAFELAAAGVGRLVLAHAGTVKPPDLNRQLLMTHAALGSSRVECAACRLRELNPRLEVVAVGENVHEGNAADLVARADVVVCCVPLFTERFLLHEQAVRQKRPFIDCAMYELSGQVTTVLPGRSACLACRTPEPPPGWQRKFPVIGAVSGTVGCLGAMEAIKLVCGIGELLTDRVLLFDLRDMRFRIVQTERRPDCRVCRDSR
jgi:molybdopterin/thiamine biosynthesis adenylyltransferase